MESDKCEIISCTQSQLAPNFITPKSLQNPTEPLELRSETSPKLTMSSNNSINNQETSPTGPTVDGNLNEWGEAPSWTLISNARTEEAEDINGNFVGWSPSTEKYWRLQYSDITAELEALQQEGPPSPAPEVEVLVENPPNADSEQAEMARKHERYIALPDPDPRRPRRNFWGQVAIWFYPRARDHDEIFQERDMRDPRVLFVTKVLLLKTFVMLCLTSIVIGLTSNLWDFLYANLTPPLIYLTTVFYVCVVVILKVEIAGYTPVEAVIILVLQTLGQSLLWMWIICTFEVFVPSSILIVLCFSYMTFAGLSGIFKVDVIFCKYATGLIIGVVAIWTLTTMAGLITFMPIIKTETARKPSIVGLLIKDFFGIFFIAETFVIISLAEILKIVTGRRFPIVCSDSEWLQSTAQLY